MPTIKARWTDGVRFVHTSDTGHALVTDAPAPNGTNTAPSPMELVLHALAGCAGVDLALILTKMKQPFRDLEITVSGERRDEHPRVYVKVAFHVTVRGEVSEKKLARAVDLSLDEYCGVAGMLRETAEISRSWEILPD
ncbi:MAG: OsmC family protein [Candidatus Krumholzibacteriia bacterium]